MPSTHVEGPIEVGKLMAPQLSHLYSHIVSHTHLSLPFTCPHALSSTSTGPSWVKNVKDDQTAADGSSSSSSSGGVPRDRQWAHTWHDDVNAPPNRANVTGMMARHLLKDPYEKTWREDTTCKFDTNLFTSGFDPLSGGNMPSV